MIWHALSIRQPWAFAILHADKDIENRDWSDRNPAMRFRGRFLIHASLHFDPRAMWPQIDSIMEDMAIERGRRPGSLPKYEKLPRGGIVGMAEVTDIVTSHASNWFSGPKGLVLANVRPLPFIECKGSLGFFEVPADIVEKLQIPEAA